MKFKELQAILQNLTKSNVTLTEIGNALGIKLSTVSTRIKNNSDLKYNEIKKIERYFNIKVVNEDNIKQSVLTFNNPLIQEMIHQSGIGMAAYGLYWALVEIISNDGISIGDEEIIAKSLSVDIKYINSILKDFKLFFIKGKNYYSAFPEHNIDQKHFKAGQFEDVKADILKEVNEMFKKRGL